MNMPDLVRGLSAISDRYDAILCDVWGVLHNGRQRYDGACRALEQFRAGGGKVILITNAPVPRAMVEQYFPPLGIAPTVYDSMVTSGDTTRAWLANNCDKPLFAIGFDEGWERDKTLFEGLAIQVVQRAEDAQLLLGMGLRDGYNDDPEDYRAELQRYLALGLPMVVPNPDIQVRIGSRLHWCGGALGRIYGELGGEVILTGKPHAPIYAQALEVLAALGGTQDRARILAIGDGPATDIRGANAHGFDAFYVGTGLHAHEGNAFAAQTEALLAAEGVHARYAMAALDW